MSPSGIKTIAERLFSEGRPVTVETYLDFAYTDPIPKPIPAEMLMEATQAVEEWEEELRQRKAKKAG